MSIRVPLLLACSGLPGLAPVDEAPPRLPGPNDSAMGWIPVERDGSHGPFLTHDGSNTMWYARAVVAPGIDRALVVVTNQGPPNGQAAVQEAEKQLRTLALE